MGLGLNEITLLFTPEGQGRTVFDFQAALEIIVSTESAAWNVLYRLKNQDPPKRLQRLHAP